MKSWALFFVIVYFILGEIDDPGGTATPKSDETVDKIEINYENKGTMP